MQSWKRGEGKVVVITEQMHLMRSPLAFQLVESSRALGWYEGSCLGRGVTSHPPPCCRSSCNQPPENFPQEDCRHHLSPLNGSVWCLVSCCCMMLPLISVDVVPFLAPFSEWCRAMRPVKWCAVGRRGWVSNLLSQYHLIQFWLQVPLLKLVFK